MSGNPPCPFCGAPDSAGRVAIPNSRIANTLNLLRSDRRRQVYEYAKKEDSRVGSGRFSITYAPDSGVDLAQQEVYWMVAKGYLIQAPDVPGLYNQGKLPT